MDGDKRIICFGIMLVFYKKQRKIFDHFFKVFLSVVIAEMLHIVIVVERKKEISKGR
jgi:putative effector of murein hydrolase